MSTLSNVQPIYDTLHEKLINNFNIEFDTKRRQKYYFTISRNHNLPFNLIVNTDLYNVPTSFQLTFNNGPIGTRYINQRQAVVNQVTNILTKQFSLTEARIIPTKTYILTSEWHSFNNRYWNAKWITTKLKKEAFIMDIYVLLI